MNVERLSFPQKQALVYLFTFVARADGRLDGKEWHYLNRYCESQGLTYDINAEISLEEICDIFDTQQAKMNAVIETAKMALSDLDYDDKEQAALNEICDQMGLPQETFEQVNQWAQEGLRWMQQSERLISA